MRKKEDAEKKLLRDILEEEELLLDKADADSQQKKARPKRVPIVKVALERPRKRTPKVARRVPVRVQQPQQSLPMASGKPMPVQQRETLPETIEVPQERPAPVQVEEIEESAPQIDSSTMIEMGTVPERKRVRKSEAATPAQEGVTQPPASPQVAVIPSHDPATDESGEHNFVQKAKEEEEIEELLEQHEEPRIEILGLIKPEEEQHINLDEHQILPFDRHEDPSHVAALESAIENYPKVHRRRVIKLSIITVLLAVLLVFVFIQFNLIETKFGDLSFLGNIGANKTGEFATINKTIEEKISFSIFNGTTGSVRVLGFLRYMVVKLPEISVSSHQFSIVDDYGNEIPLTKVTDQQARLFVPGQTTTRLYEISGILARTSSGAELRVTSIRPGIRPVKIVSDVLPRD